MGKTTRREFIRSSLAGGASLAMIPLSGCASAPPVRREVIDVPGKGYPLVEVEGTYRDIGRKLGETMRGPIQEYFEHAEDYPRCMAYLRKNGERILRMLALARARYPHLVEEVEGMAEGLGMPFMALFAYQCRSEISVLSSPAGCSTLSYSDAGRMILAHNEDGNDRNMGRMYIAKVTPPSGVRFVSFVYPGLIPGNGPGFNQYGVVQTTNYIQPKEVADGVPRYFISRAILEAESLEKAVALATQEGRAFPWHHNLASLTERRILSVETMPDRHHVMEVVGFSIHTNHLIHKEMVREGAGEQDLPYESSLTRMRVLRETTEVMGTPTTHEEMVRYLALHEGRPYSPCRHPQGTVHGATLGTAVFEAPKLSMTLYHGNPCQGFAKWYAF